MQQPAPSSTAPSRAHARPPLGLEEITRDGPQLVLRFRAGGMRFSTTYWYGDVDFAALDARYGTAFMDKVVFHIAAFEINKLASLYPEIIDWGPYARFATPEFRQLWETVLYNVWAQWRYENDLPDYRGPRFETSAAGDIPGPVPLEPGPIETLAFCGGGKDSLVTMKALERAGVAHDSLVYASSIYGTAAQQHALIDRLLDHGAQRARRRQWIYDDFLDAPVLELRREVGIETLCAAETPASVFASLPLVLTHGYRYIALGHERSADTGQVVWDATGEWVNHQWGKSYEAEAMINAYVGAHLVEGFTYFSVLKPVYDVLIFNMLRRDLDAVPATHSCNIRKPWCGRCPKCAYVWLNYMAHLPTELVDGMFGENLFDLPENQETFRQLIGLEDQLPFECIGQEGESRLAFEMCRAKGLRGRAMEMFEREAGAVDTSALVAKYLDVNEDAKGIPPAIRDGLFDQFRDAAGEARVYIDGVLGG